MELAVVIGNITSTVNHPAYNRCKLLLIENVDINLCKTGNVTVAVDTVDAGCGDIVLVAREGKTASDILGIKQAPVRSMIIGYVDSLGIMKQSKTEG
ncbi:MAG TPA: EutN/CcmL family microcompartment protein [bacterium]|nr:EutN/CcmL family microcompartment protein [bacterium]HPN42175.1 EutN/CcmL family microcompartment protein [bacterium]